MDTEEPTQTCIFKNYDSVKPDAFPKISRSLVACDDNQLSLRKIYEQRRLFNLQLHGAENIIDLMLSRVGTFKDMSFWSDAEKLDKLLNKVVCKNHFYELYFQWYRKPHRKIGRGKKICNYPEELGGNDGNIMFHTLTKQESLKILEKTGKIVQTGVELCRKHSDEVENMMKKDTPEDTDTESDDISGDMESLIAEETISTLHKKRKEDVKSCTKKLGYNRLITKNQYDSLGQISKERKIRTAKNLFLDITSVIAPHREEQFMNDVCKVYGYSDDKSSMNFILTQVAQQYEMAGDKRTRLFAIGSVVNVVNYPELRKYIPNLTEYMFREAVKLIRDKDLPKTIEKPRRYERYEKEEIKKFVAFLTSPICLVSLPFGIKKATLSDKTPIDIPNTIRLQRHAEIIRMFNASRKEEEKGNKNWKPLSRSTMFAICHRCYAVRSKALTCVDYFLADGYEAFDYLEKVINDWQNQGTMPSIDGNVLKRQLSEGRLYLRTDFNVALKEHSTVLSHCLTYALSHRNDPKFQRQCESSGDAPVHTILCERCEQLRYTLMEIEDFATQQREKCIKDTRCSDDDADDREILEISIRNAVFNIHEMKKHLVRSRYSNLQRKQIVSNIEEGFALVTLDFAQKLLPMKHLETQADYFGKKGMSYHISHVLSKKDDAYVEHSYVHILDEKTQDSTVVIAIIIDVLRNISKIGITNVILRSDNAANYHCRDVVLSLDRISEVTGVQITRYAFSEPQSGKSSCDRKAAHVKNRVRDYVDKPTNNVENTTQFFAALMDPEPLSFTTVSTSRIKRTNQPNGNRKNIVGISTYYDFVPERNGVRAFNFFGIGEGKLYKYADYHPLTHLPVMEHVDIYNPLDPDDNDDDDDDVTEDEETVEDNEVSEEDNDNEKLVFKYWRSTTTLSKHKKSPQNQANMFYCPDESCDATFITNGELEAHLVAGIHNDREAEKRTLLDYALLQFVDSIDGHFDTSDEIETVVRQSIIEDSRLTNLNSLSEGWAHRSARQNPKLTPDSKAFLTQLFYEGETNKRKLTGVDGLQRMRAERTSTGERRFRAPDLLRPEQITSFFSRVSAGRKKASGEPQAKRRKTAKKPSSTTEQETEDDTFDDDLLESDLLNDQRTQELRQSEQAEIQEMVDNARREFSLS